MYCSALKLDTCQCRIGAAEQGATWHAKSKCDAVHCPDKHRRFVECEYGVNCKQWELNLASSGWIKPCSRSMWRALQKAAQIQRNSSNNGWGISSRSRILNIGGYVNNRVAARLRGIYCKDDTLDVAAQHWPLGVAQHDERDSTKY